MHRRMLRCPADDIGFGQSGTALPPFRVAVLPGTGTTELGRGDGTPERCVACFLVVAIPEGLAGCLMKVSLGMNVMS